MLGTTNVQSVRTFLFNLHKAQNKLKGDFIMEKEQLEMYRHSMAHILAKALKEIYGEKLKLTIGPAIDTGFYYDVDCDKAITPEDFDAIQNKMKEIIKRQEDFVRKEVSKKRR